MLYKKNAALCLDKALFETPTAEYRGTPFWSFNTKLDKDVLRRQSGYFKQMGFGGAHMHVRTGLATDYLSDEFMDVVADCCDTFEQNEMLAWLYDEDRYSSGYAGGMVTRDHRYRRRTLCFYPEDKGWNTPKETALETGEAYLLGCYDILLNADGTLESYRLIDPTATAQGTKWYAYSEPETPNSWHNGGTHMDFLNREATEKFIALTHERYNDWVGERFGSSISAIFTDEPQIMHLAWRNLMVDAHTPQFQSFGWSRYFEEEYTARYGEDIIPHLPLLIWYTPDRSDAPFKYRYYDLTGDLFRQNYCKVIGDWCKAHNLAFTGHMLNEPKLIYQTYACADAMRQYGEFDLPGIDMLCDDHEYVTAKQCQSAVHQQGKEGMVSELYGVTNWDFDFMGHKSQGDWQAALGVTVRVPHLSWVSMAGEAKRDYPASISYQSPWYTQYSFIENHFARLNTALTRGEAITRIGVVHPIESMWLTRGPLNLYESDIQALQNDFTGITEFLLSHQLDFDFICESTLPELQGEDPQGVGRCRYDAIVVPRLLTLRTTTLEFLKRFKENGGTLIFTGDCPAFVDGVPCDGAAAVYDAAVKVPPQSDELLAVLESYRDVMVNSERYFYQYRTDGDCRWLFIAPKNRADAEDTAPFPVTVNVSGTFAVEEYHTLSGEVCPVAYTAESGKTTVTANLYGYDSLLLKLTPAQPLTSYALPLTSTHAAAPVKTGTWQYALSERNVLLLDQAEYALDDGRWQPKDEMLRLDNRVRDILRYPRREGETAQPYTVKTLTEGHTLHLRFTVMSEIAVDDATLSAEEMETARLTVNGIPVEKRMVGYYTDECIKTVALPPLHAGENVITVSLPFTELTNPEWMYLQGSFGVKLQGDTPVLTAKPATLAFESVTEQGLPFYGANITYSTRITPEKAGTVTIAAPRFAGAAVTAAVDGVQIGNLSLPPFAANVPLEAGEHTVSVTLYGNRFNSFGQLHCTDLSGWIGPNKWRTEGDQWTYGYCLKPFGLLQEPTLTIE